jgi:uncharacterized iron-regulated membrane protein
MGLVLGTWLLVQVLSGTVLIFEDNIISDAPTNSLIEDNKTPIKKILTILETDYPKHKLLRIEYPTLSRTNFIVRTQHKTSKETYYKKYLPSTDELIAFNLFEYTTIWLFKLHDDLFLYETGRNIVGVLGGTLFLWVCSGVYLWWPSRKRRALKVSWSGPYHLKIYDIHRVVGILVSVFLLVISITGVGMSYRGALLEVFDNPNAISESSIKEQYLFQCLQYEGIDTVINCFTETIGISSVKDIRFNAQNDQIKVLLYASDHYRKLAVDTIDFSMNNITPVNVNLATQESTAKTILNWMYPLHTGKALGRFGKFIMFIVGLMTSLLIVVGWLIWWNKNKGTKNENKIRT